MFVPQSPYTKIAFESLQYYFENGYSKKGGIEGIPEELYEIKRACFVSLHMQADRALRGCIGTLEPQEENLVYEIQRNAISAALHDHRFDPLKKSELKNIVISVDVLSEPEQVFSMEELDTQYYGLILSDKMGRRGVLLPGLEGVDTIDKQINIVKRKAGLQDVPEEQLNIFRFTSSRYN